MAPTTTFNSAAGFAYPGDAFSELVRVFNVHSHSLVAPTNFLAYPLSLNTEVGFTGLSNGIADPFGAIGSAVPLKVVAIERSKLTLSRTANVSAVGTLTYNDGTAYRAVASIACVQDSDEVTFHTAVNLDRSGQLSPQALEVALTKEVLIHSAINILGQTTAPQVLSPTELSVNIDGNGFYQIETYTGPNPKLVLRRGAIYKFNITTAARDRGGFHLTRDLQDPILGLLLYTQGVTQTTGTNSSVTITVGYDAPPFLFYQSTTSPYIYGTIEIIGGDYAALPNVYDAWTAPVPTIPLQVPDRTITLNLGTAFKYRVAKWVLQPEWNIPVSAQTNAYAQLQYSVDGINMLPLTKLTKLQNVNPVELQAGLVPEILPANAVLKCAVYEARNLKAITQQVNLITIF